jgi:HTH-type transcriptional regulator/antitoxin HigA
MNTTTSNLHQHWATISPILTIRNEYQYDQAVEYLNSLLDEIGTNEHHPLYTLLDTLGTILHAYGSIILFRKLVALRFSTF